MNLLKNAFSNRVEKSFTQIIKTNSKYVLLEPRDKLAEYGPAEMKRDAHRV